MVTHGIIREVFLTCINFISCFIVNSKDVKFNLMNKDIYFTPSLVLDLWHSICFGRTLIY